MLKHNKLLMMILLVITVTIGQIAGDIYLPSIPSIAKYYATSINNAELTLFYFTLGFSIGALIYGPLSDMFGRRILIIISLAVGVWW